MDMMLVWHDLADAFLGVLIDLKDKSIIDEDNISKSGLADLSDIMADEAMEVLDIHGAFIADQSQSPDD